MRLVDIVNRAFGESDDHSQAEFLNSLGESLLQACQYDHNKVEGQLCYVSSKLNKHGEELVLKLADFVRLRKENE